MYEYLQKLAEGNTAEIFHLDNNRILKLFKYGYSKDSMLHEYYNHQVVSGLLDSAPNLYEIVEEDDRFGYIMEHIKGTTLAERLLNEATFTDAMELFVSLHKEWNKEAPAEVVSYKDWMKALVGNRESTSELLEKIHCLPEGNTLCHGDFHPYNILVTEENKPVVIDFANVCRAPKKYDIARTYFLMEEAGVKQMAEVYLEQMQTKFEEIQEFYKVIVQLRKFELE